MTKQFLSVALHISHTETVYTFCRQKLYKMYTLMYTKCIEDVYHISTNFCKFKTFKTYTTLKELRRQLNFVYKMYTNFVKMRDTFSTQTFCIHFVHVISDLQKVLIIKIICTICTQNSCRIYMQIILCKMDIPFPIF